MRSLSAQGNPSGRKDYQRTLPHSAACKGGSCPGASMGAASLFPAWEQRNCQVRKSSAQGLKACRRRKAGWAGVLGSLLGSWRRRGSQVPETWSGDWGAPLALWPPCLSFGRDLRKAHHPRWACLENEVLGTQSWKQQGTCWSWRPT